MEGHALAELLALSPAGPGATVFKKIRIAILLLILINVGVGTWLTQMRTTSWDHSLRVAVFAIPGDDSPATQKYIANLSNESFASINEFFREEAKRYGLPLGVPVEVRFARVLTESPPEPPFGESGLSVIAWSLKMRWWAWQHGKVDGPKPHARIFVRYHDPKLTSSVAHSLGLQKGLIGVVNAFASKDMAQTNNVVIAHELLHTVGGTDKYDPSTNQPQFPDGYGDPEQKPLHPQQYAEIMAGRIALSQTEADMPHNLSSVLMGDKTAREIGWMR